MVEYLVGAAHAPPGTAMEVAGDPAMLVAVPAEQYRTSYLVHAPTSFRSNYLSVIAPIGTVVTIDANPVDGWHAVDGSNWQTATISLAAGSLHDGNHRVDATAAVGITVYGYGDYSSYWYPGGLDVRSIVIE